MFPTRAAILMCLTAPAVAAAQTPAFGGFVDTYFAYDFGRPAGRDRSFTTQPARHSEFNINLAHLEIRLDGERLRGRLALQAGTSVQSNYAGEPALGGASGPALARHIQEAVVGTRLGTGLWLDAGIFFSHLGSESFLSRDNPTYTRSLIADYSPYYQAGVKLTWTPSPTLTAQVNIVNGWQNISENNDAKAVGLRFDIMPSSTAALSIYHFLGNEQPADAESRLRAFQGASLKLMPSGKTTLIGTFDFGWQEGAEGGESSTWHGAALIARVQASPKVAIAARVERYADPDEVIVATGSENGFQVNGVSLGLDVSPVRNLLWRIELRGLGSKDRIYPDRGEAGGASTRNAFLVTSLGVTF
ncbi:MAG: porin [Gemmatimonadales bacterium]|nr:porin [Gemmatimonadales bacterium]